MDNKIIRYLFNNNLTSKTQMVNYLTNIIERIEKEPLWVMEAMHPDNQGSDSWKDLLEVQVLQE